MEGCQGGCTAAAAAGELIEGAARSCVAACVCDVGMQDGSANSVGADVGRAGAEIGVVLADEVESGTSGRRHD